MVKTQACREMKDKSVCPFKSSSTKRKKSPQSEENPSPDLPIVNVPFQEKDSDVSVKAGVPARSSNLSVAKKKAVAKKNAFPP